MMFRRCGLSFAIGIQSYYYFSSGISLFSMLAAPLYIRDPMAGDSVTAKLDRRAVATRKNGYIEKASHERSDLVNVSAISTK
jgi:hypothetical protein